MSCGCQLCFLTAFLGRESDMQEKRIHHDASMKKNGKRKLILIIANARKMTGNAT
jgi:hypothetical protein